MIGRSRYIPNDLPGCPKGGLLSGSDVIYGGPGVDFLDGGAVNGHDRSKNVLYGGDGGDMLFGAAGEDVLHGGDGNDYLDGRDQYIAGRLDYVSSSCEKGKLADTGGPPTMLLLAGAAPLLGGGLLAMSRLSRPCTSSLACPRLP